MHGATYALLADEWTTNALVSLDNQRRFGVSVHLATEYLLAAPRGTVMFVDCRALRVGKFLGVAEAIFLDDKGTIFARSQHTKFMGVAKL